MTIISRKVEQGDRTRKRLIEAGRRLFSKGYESIGTPAIAQAAGVTRGALYHHFADKRALFAAVVDEVARDLTRRIDADAMQHDEDPVEAVVAGCRTFVSAALDDETRRIFLVDAPAVLGWSEWRRIDTRHGFGSLKAGLEACADRGLMRRADVEALTHLLSGALNEAVFAIAENPSNADLQSRFNHVIERLIREMLSSSPGDAA